MEIEGSPHEEKQGNEKKINIIDFMINLYDINYKRLLNIWNGYLYFRSYLR